MYRCIFAYYVITVSVLLCQTINCLFTIHNKGCTIPEFPVSNKHIDNYFKFPEIKNNCTEFIALADFNKSHIWINDSALSSYNIIVTSDTDFFCCYRNFSTNNFIENVTYGECIRFETVIEARHAFVRIECYYQDSKIYDDFFLFTKLHQAHRAFKSDDMDFNILIIGIESISRLNFLRAMPKTAKFLKRKGSIQLLGYNKLGDNSLPNLIPLLTGKSVDHIKLCTYNNMLDTNTCRFLWDLYKNAGFVTAMGSDSTAGLLGTYEYQFGKKPTDYYLQPFMFETRNLFKNREYNFHLCVKQKFAYKLLLDFIADVAEMEKKNRLFGFFWEESVSHEDINYPRIMDTEYERLLKTLEDMGSLKNTVLIFLSDHGMRWGDFVQTKQGRHEERLPLVEVLYPSKFKLKYNMAFKNFKRNKNKLTSAFDIYHTLLDLKNQTQIENRQITNRMKSQKLDRTSLFLPVPSNRTCSTIGISSHWCACRQGVLIPPGDETKTLAAHKLINVINKTILEYPQCHKLKVKRILEVSMVRDAHGSTYLVMLEASPGGAIFDGTLRMERGLWAMSGTVSRYNLYRDQSNCVNDNYIKMYCFCK